MDVSQMERVRVERTDVAVEVAAEDIVSMSPGNRVHVAGKQSRGNIHEAPSGHISVITTM